MSNRRALLVIILASIGIILVLGLLAIPLRSWIRSTLAVKISHATFGTSTFTTFDREFLPIEDMLKSNGFALTGKSLPLLNQYDTAERFGTAAGCGLEGYEGIHETVTCQKIREYKPTSPQNFEAQWKKRAPAVVRFLEAHGWRKDYSDQPSYTELFDGPADYGRWLSYVKNRGVIRCSLTVAYNPPYPELDDQIWIEEHCGRDVKFFGGY